MSAQPALARLDLGLVNIFTEQKEGFLAKTLDVAPPWVPYQRTEALRHSLETWLYRAPYP